MKSSGILITGALAVLAIAVSSCANSGTQSASATPAAATAANSPPAPAETAANSPTPPPAAAAASSPAVPVPIGQYFNDQGIYPDGVTFTGGIDRDGNACSSIALAGQKWNDIPIQLGGSNVITAAGQTIALTQSGNFSKLKLLALAVNGAQEDQNFTVTYVDGSTQAFTQSLSDWAQPDSNPGETTAITMNYRNQADGTKDENPFYIFSYTFNLNSSKTPQSLKLPDNNNVKVFAAALAP